MCLLDKSKMSFRSRGHFRREKLIIRLWLCLLRPSMMSRSDLSVGYRAKKREAVSLTVGRGNRAPSLASNDPLFPAKNLDDVIDNYEMI